MVITLLKGALVAIGAGAWCLVMASLLVKLPEEPMLRAAALSVPFLAGVGVAVSWHEAGAPWPSMRAPACSHRRSPATGVKQESKAAAVRADRQPANVL